MIQRLIRPATLQDASSLAALALEVWLSTYIRNGINAFFADYALNEFTAARFEQFLLCKSRFIWVSQNSVGIDGFIHLSTGSKPPLDTCSDLEIVTLYIQPRHQGSGVGRRLLEAGLDFCATTGRPDVWLSANAENQNAISFYSKMGFTKVGETYFRIGDQSYLNYVLGRSLRSANY